MSKAFVKEGDDAPELDDDLPDELPAGSKNYMTPAGFRRLQDELAQLRRVERPEVVKTVTWAASNGDRSENGDYLYGKRRLREIDRRMRFLTKRLECAFVVEPSQQKQRDRAFFGATVTYAGDDDREHTVTIVGVDEIAFGDGYISWISPVARALTGARVGEQVTVRTPRGMETVEVLTIDYRAGGG
jgi:transcription elongation factor GreB